MTKMIPTARKLLLLLLLAVASASHADAPPQQGYTENIAVIRLLKRMDLLPTIRSRLAHPPAADPRLQEVMLYMSTRVTDDDIYRGMSPLYARYISISDANRLAFGPADAQAYTKLKNQVQPAFDEALVNWGRDFYMRLLVEGMKNIIASTGRHQPGAALPDPTPKPIGLAAVDQALAAIADARTVSASLDEAFEKNFPLSAFEDLLKPERLVTPAGIAQSKADLHRIEAELEHYISARDKLQSAYRQRMEAIFSDKGLRAELEIGWSILYKREIEYTENERVACGLYRRVLDFAESRQGKIHAENGELTFDDDDDIDLFDALMNQMEKLGYEKAEQADKK